MNPEQRQKLLHKQMLNNEGVPTGDHTVVVRRYVHDEQDEDSAIQWAGDPEECEGKYSYSLYEVQIDLEVDLLTGNSEIVAVDGRLLSEEATPW